MAYESYHSLRNHPFVSEIFKKAMEIEREVGKPNGFKVNESEGSGLDMDKE